MIKLIFGNNKADICNACEKKDVICLGLGELLFEAYEELDLSKKKVEIVSLEKLESDSELIINNDKIIITSLDKMVSAIGKDRVIIVTASLKDYLENENYVNGVLANIDVEAYLYYSVRNELKLSERSIERQKKIIRRKNNLKSMDARTISESLIPTDRLIIPKLNILVTDKCSLRCKDCRALVPMVRNPQDEPLEKVIKEIDTILEVVDGVVDIEPIGGEPFLYPNLPELLEYLCSQDKIMNVCISTNATVIPNERCLEVLKNKKIFIYVSDYGYIEMMAKVVSSLESAGVSFVVESNQKWSDVGGINFRNRDLDSLRKEYMNCFGQFMVKYVWDNKLWLCPRAPRLNILKVLDSSHDYIDLLGFNSKKELQEAIINSFFENYAESCNYCNQGDIEVVSIPAGLQMNCNDKKSRFTIINREELKALLQSNKQ